MAGICTALAMCQASFKFNPHSNPRGVSYSYAHFTDEESEVKEVTFQHSRDKHSLRATLPCALQYVPIFPSVNIKSNLKSHSSISKA